MDTEEFVKTLRSEAQFQSDRFRREILASKLNNAADTIESLQRSLENYKKEIDYCKSVSMLWKRALHLACARFAESPGVSQWEQYFLQQVKEEQIHGKI